MNHMQLLPFSIASAVEVPRYRDKKDEIHVYNEARKVNLSKALAPI